jgi:hypothetical protein
VFLNSALLFTVLFYVYPLKFLFTLTVGSISGALTAQRELAAINVSQVSTLMVVFSLGYSAVFGVFALLYRYAYSKRRELDLNEFEALRTRHDMVHNTVVACVGLLVPVTAELLPVRWSFYSIFLLCLTAVYGLVSKPIFRKRERLALERVQAASAAAATP